jgi:hypothetical protein
MRRAAILAAALLASAAPARAQSWCMAYMQQGANGGVLLCPPAGSFDLNLTPEQFDYFKRRSEVFSARITRKGKECFHNGVDAACEVRVDRELPIPPVTPEAMRYLARFGFTEKTAR